MKYTILTAVLNRRDDIVSMFKSILIQTHKDFEVIIVDNGSTDGTLDLCRNWAEIYPFVKVFSCSERGLAFARNVGIRNASSDYCIILDSDNCFSSEDSIKSIDFQIYDKTPLAIFSFAANEKGLPVSFFGGTDQFINLDSYLRLVKGELPPIVNTAWFKEHLYPEFIGLTSELPLLVWIPLIKTERVYLTTLITQVYSTGASNRISASSLSKKRATELTVYYFELCQRHGKDIQKISKIIYLKIIFKSYIYNRISDRYSLGDMKTLDHYYVPLALSLFPKKVFISAVKIFKLFFS